MELTQEDLKNILVLISSAPINGSQATTVAMLQNKINAMMIPEQVVEEQEAPVNESEPKEKPKKG